VHRRSAWLGWSVLAVFLASVAGVVALDVRQDALSDLAQKGPLLVAFAAFSVVGALILAHRPGNAIGWLFAGAGLLATTGGLAEAYARTGLGRPALPGAVLAAWWASWTWFPTLAFVLLFTPLLFPSGRPLSGNWWPVVWLGALTTATVTTLAIVQPTLAVDGAPTVPNPFAVGPFGNPEETAVGSVTFVLLILLVLAAMASVVIRFRRSRGDERQRLKWFTYAGALLPLVFLGDVLPGVLGDLVFSLVIAALPAAAGVAILRHRLYDIDRLINRTLVYALLTALLAAVYAGLILVLAQGVGGLDGQAPSWIVAASTLAVAALFQPARRRIQAAVDRRFDRRRYDAGRTIQAFSVRLRDQVDLGTLSAELLAVVDQTLQPTTASLWLRPRG
jgi:hypothetical protein